MEGVFYAVGAVLFFAMAGLLFMGRGKSPLMYLCSAAAVLVYKAWQAKGRNVPIGS